MTCVPPPHSSLDVILLGPLTHSAPQWLTFCFCVWCPHPKFRAFSSVQSLSCVRLFVTPWTSARQASLSITNSQSLPKLMFIESVMPSNHLILFRPLLLPSIFSNIRVFSNESALCIRWPKYWSFSFNIIPSSEHPGLISFRMAMKKEQSFAICSNMDRPGGHYTTWNKSDKDKYSMICLICGI